MRNLEDFAFHLARLDCSQYYNQTELTVEKQPSWEPPRYLTSEKKKEVHKIETENPWLPTIAKDPYWYSRNSRAR